MASIIDSFKENIGDKLSLFKAFVLAIPLYYSYQLLITTKGDFTGATVIALVTLFILFGFLLETVYENIDGQTSGMIGLNPFKILFAGILGLIALAPVGIILSIIAVPIISFINITPEVNVFVQFVVWFLAVSVVVTQLLLFAKDRSLKNAYDLKTIYLRGGDTMVALFKFTLGLFLLNLVTFVLFGYVLWSFVGFSIWTDAYISIAIIYNISIFGHYLAQMQHDVIEYPKIKDIII